MNKQYFAYIRVSTVKQGEGVSLAAQKEAIEAYAFKHGLVISTWFEEKETAAKQGRPVFSAMLKKLYADNAEGLIIHKIDRSARNLRDWATIGELQDSGIEVHFAAESVDFSSRGGRLTADIQAVIAADYIRNLREETIKGINGRLKQGLYPFKAPIGYLDNGGGKVKTIDPIKGPLVKELFELYASGEHSINSLIGEMEKQGLRNRYGKPVTKSGIEKILNNPFYMGQIYIKRRNEIYEGKHQALISSRLFGRVQAIKADRHVKRKTKHSFLYRGLFDCALCRRSLIAEKQKGHVYYRCHTKDCETKTVRETILNERLFQSLREYEMGATAIALSSNLLLQRLQQKPKVDRTDTSSMQLAKVQTRKDQLLDALLDKLIDKDTYNRRLQAVLLEQSKLKEQQKNKPNFKKAEVYLKKFLELSKSLTGTYLFANDSEKRQLLKILFSNRLLTGKRLELAQRKWILERLNLLSALVGDPCGATSRNSQDLGCEAIPEVIDNIICPELVEFNDLCEGINQRHCSLPTENQA